MRREPKKPQPADWDIAVRLILAGLTIEEPKDKQGRRPQPAGWDKAIKDLLRPEHVERISDTKIRITLPAAPDFDIDEDEIVRVRIPASALMNATRDIDGGTITIRAASFEERIDNALHGLQEERNELGDCSKLATFLLTFFTCEIVAKAIVSLAKYGPSKRKASGDKWSTSEVSSALAKLGIRHDAGSLDALFSEERAIASEMSARVLRDSVAHRMKTVHRRAVRARFTQLMREMDRFLEAVAGWRERRAYQRPDE
jgi:hypothetical protein